MARVDAALASLGNSRAVLDAVLSIKGGVAESTTEALREVRDAVEGSVQGVADVIIRRMDGMTSTNDGMRQAQEQLATARRNEAVLKSRVEELEKVRCVCGISVRV
jgi:BMFP domain-containing protein YqiC